MVGALAANGSTVDNLHRAYANVSVLPHRRREGIGSLLLAEAEELGPRRRTPGARPARSSPRWATPARPWRSPSSHGFRVTMEDGMKVVDIPETRDRWAGLAAEAAPYHRDYELRTVVVAAARRARGRLLRDPQHVHLRGAVR